MPQAAFHEIFVEAKSKLEMELSEVRADLAKAGHG